MCENQRFETRMKLFFANFWNPTQVFKRWKLNIKKKLGWVFQNILILRPNNS
jgi:hypothetical protein